MLLVAFCSALVLLLCEHRASAALSTHSFPVGNDASKPGNGW